jgi:hypothetical protein
MILDSLASSLMDVCLFNVTHVLVLEYEMIVDPVTCGCVNAGLASCKA